MNSKEAIISFLNLFKCITVKLSVITLRKIPADHLENRQYKTYFINDDGDDEDKWISVEDFIYVINAESHLESTFLDVNQAADYLIRLSKV
jgi:hypothetical protein